MNSTLLTLYICHMQHIFNVIKNKDLNYTTANIKTVNKAGDILCIVTYYLADMLHIINIQYRKHMPSKSKRNI